MKSITELLNPGNKSEEAKPNQKKDLKTSDILYTTNFSLFKFHSLQRPLHDNKTVREEFVRCGFWAKRHPLTCNHKYEILDGQNRFLVAQELGFKGLFYQMVYTSCLDEDIEVMNSTNNVGSGWSIIDCLTSNKSQGLKSSIEVLHFMEKRGLNISNAMVVCCADEKVALKRIRNRMDFELLPKRYELAEFLSNFSDLPFFTETKFNKAIKRFFLKATKKNIENLLLKRMTIKKQPDVTSYCIVFCNIVNKGLKGGQELHL